MDIRTQIVSRLPGLYQVAQRFKVEQIDGVITEKADGFEVVALGYSGSISSAFETMGAAWDEAKRRNEDLLKYLSLKESPPVPDWVPDGDAMLFKRLIEKAFANVALTANSAVDAREISVDPAAHDDPEPEPEPEPEPAPTDETSESGIVKPRRRRFGQ